MEGRGIVEAIRSGDPTGLAAAYDQYGERLYGYCWSLLKDDDSAADALHDTLLLASERIDQLRDPERLRAWLYAIARNECMRQLRRRRRSVSLEEASEVSDESVDLDAAPREQELRALVRDAASGLSPRDREVLELAIRHDLDPADMAATLQVSQSHARALLSRVREQLDRALGAVLVARDRSNDCPELAVILAGWEGQMTVLLRKRVNRHLESCRICAETRRRLVSAPSLLSILIPLPLPPVDLRARVLRDAFDPKLVGYRAQLGARAGHFGSDGFPLARRFPRLPQPLVAAAAISLLGAAGIFFGALHAWGLQTPLASVPPLASGSQIAIGETHEVSPSAGPIAAQTAAPTGTKQVSPASTARQNPSPTLPLLIVPPEVDLHRASSGQIQIGTRAGQVDWTATVSDPTLKITPAKGRAPTNADTSPAVSVPTFRSAGKATVTFSYAWGSVSTVVTWDQVVIILPPLPPPTSPSPPPIP